ncbi:MAG: LysR substrate-binding domain-containing protein [Novosphingobium sp.]
MNFRRLHCFLAAAEEENFGRAADRLHIVHSAFSRHIQHLEADLGVELFERSGRRVKLSEAGRIYAIRVGELLDSFERANEDLRVFAAKSQISLSMALQEDIGGQSSMAAMLRSTRLGVDNLTINYVPMPSMDQPAALQRREIDVGLIYGDPTITRGLEHMTVAQDRYRLAVSRTHPFAMRESVRLEELAAESFVHIATHRNPGLQKDLLARCKEIGFEPRIGHRASTISGILTLVATEGAVALMPELIGVTEAFTCVPIEGFEVTIPVDLIWRTGDDSPLLRQYIASWRKQAGLTVDAVAA